MSKMINITFPESNFLARPLDFNSYLYPSVRFREIDQLNQSEFETQIVNQDILILNDLKITPAVLSNNPNLKLVALCSTGYDNQPVELLREKCIHLCNVRDYASHNLAEHAFMLIMNLAKNFSSYSESVMNGKWSNSNNFCYLEKPICELYNKNLVIIGSGTSGKALASRAQAFGMNVIFSERKDALKCRKGYIPFWDAIKAANVISLHCELNDNTYQLIDEQVLSICNKGTLLINIARGGLVNEHAILQSLMTGKLAGYATDTLIEEPPNINHPFLNVNLSNLLITPHIAWASQEAKHRLSLEIQENLHAYLQGKPKNLVV